MIGASTSFYGYGGSSILIKAEGLIRIFKSTGLSPYIQLGAAIPGACFREVSVGLKGLKDRYDVKYSVHQSMWLPSLDFILNLASSDRRIRRLSVESLKRSIDLAREIDAENLSFHGGYASNVMVQDEEFQPLAPRNPIPWDEAYSNTLESISELQSYSAGSVNLSVENLNHRPERRYLFSKPEDFRNLPSSITVLLNIGHLYYSQQIFEDLNYSSSMIEAVGGRISEIHANDNDGTEDQHKLIGYGCVPFQEILRMLACKQKIPPIIVEAHKVRHNYTDEDLVANIKYLDEVSSRLQV